MSLGFLARAILTYRATARCRYLAKLQSHAATCSLSGDIDRCHECLSRARQLQGALNAVEVLRQAGDTILSMPCDEQLDLLD